MSEVRETLYPTTKSIISSVAKERGFKSSDGSDWHGIEVTFDNGDCVKVWNTSPVILDQFQVGKEVTYTKKLVEKNGKEGWKLADYSFPIPRVERFEPMVVPKVADAITYAASYAKDMCVADGNLANFETYADRMFEWMRHKLLNEKFE
jgi:hypothetical protein